MILTRKEFEMLSRAKRGLIATDLLLLSLQLGNLLENSLIVTVRDLGYRKITGPPKRKKPATA